MKVAIQLTSIPAEAILFSDANKEVIIVGKGEKQLVLKDKQVFPLYPKGRLINFEVEYDKEYYKSFVIGFDKEVKKIGYVIGNKSPEDVLKAVENDSIEYTMEYMEHLDSKILILFFE